MTWLFFTLHVVLLAVGFGAWHLHRQAVTRERMARVRAEHTMKDVSRRLSEIELAHARILHDLKGAACAVGPILEDLRSAPPNENDANDIRSLFERISLMASATGEQAPRTTSGAFEKASAIESIVRVVAKSHEKVARVRIEKLGRLAISRELEGQAMRLVDNLVANAARESQGLGDVWVTVTPEGLVVQNLTRDPAKAEQCLRERRSGHGSSGLGISIVSEMAANLGWTVRWHVSHGDRTVTVHAGPIFSTKPAVLRAANDD